VRPAAGVQIQALIPHRGAMCLLERVVHWDERQVTAATRTHRSPDNPLRREGRLHALHLAEYGAQAAAVHGGLLARAHGAQAPPRLLAAIRDLRLQCADLTQLAGELILTATLLIEDGGGCQYGFAVEHAGVEIASGRVAILRRG